MCFPFKTREGIGSGPDSPPNASSTRGHPTWRRTQLTPCSSRPVLRPLCRPISAAGDALLPAAQGRHVFPGSLPAGVRPPAPCPPRPEPPAPLARLDAGAPSPPPPSASPAAPGSTPGFLSVPGIPSRLFEEPCRPRQPLPSTCRAPSPAEWKPRSHAPRLPEACELPVAAVTGLRTWWLKQHTFVLVRFWRSEAGTGYWGLVGRGHPFPFPV